MSRHRLGHRAPGFTLEGEQRRPSKEISDSPKCQEENKQAVAQVGTARQKQRPQATSTGAPLKNFRSEINFNIVLFNP